MSAQTFDQPISVLVGLGFVRTVSTVMAAYQIVSEWSASPRSLAQVAALSACRAALNGEGKVEDAHAAFLDFAGHAGILMDDPAPVPALAQPSAPGLVLS